MDNGAHFYCCDLQVHTPRDLMWSGPDRVTDDERRDYAVSLIRACRDRGVHAIAVTDHHDMAFIPYIREAARAERDEEGNPVLTEMQVTVFPGMELTLAVPCQALVIFDADFPQDLFELALHALAITANHPGEAKTAEVERLDHISTLTQLRSELDKHQYLRSRYIILPNVSDGGADTLLRKGNAPKYKEMPCVGGYVDGSITRLGTGNLNIVTGRAREWGNKRIALFQTSDNRDENHKDLGRHTTWAKWATPTAEALRQACLAQESRISQEEPVLPSTVITSIGVSNSRFLGPVALELNSQYTALIGGRGTGKSTLLEYLRWALCDQQPDPTADDELPNFQARRRSLVEQTLTSLGATVQVKFLVNGVPHAVRRNSESHEILLKVADGEFSPCKELDVRSLLPVQAYSQKQLSNVSVRLDELSRFVQAPIREQLNDLERSFASIAGECRELHAAIQRKRAIEKAIKNDELSVASLATQAETIRKALTGLSKEDQEVLASRQSYEEAQSVVQAWRDDVVRVITVIDSLHDELQPLPSAPHRNLDELPEPDVLRAIQGEVQSLLADIKASVQQMTDRLTKVISSEGEFQGSLAETWARWTTAHESFEAAYEGAKKKSTAHESKLKELGTIEDRISELRGKLAAARRALVGIGNPENRFNNLRAEWRQLHNERAELLEAECTALTVRSQEEIRATVRRGAGVDEIVEKLRGTVTGSGVRREKLEAVGGCVKQADNPVRHWDDVLAELEVLAEHDPSEEAAEPLPALPLLSGCGLTGTDLLKMATRFNPDPWLELALTRLEDHPVFEFRTREQEYIPFANASAGQQATSLLKALLNQPGPPLIIDQPEDDLDNPVVSEVVEQIWDAKNGRQLIFTSHNANLVVNGDAELVVWCDHRIAGDHSAGKVEGEGAIDIPRICDAIKQVMEGGEKAFKLRKDKYGF